jgi:hypothetical protein
MTPACTICGTRLDAVWADMGYTTHVTCEGITACQHGEPRGSRFCAICRKANHMVMPPDPRPAVGRNVTLVAPSHPATSQHAANRALPSTGSKRRMVLDAISASEVGLCDWQLERLFNWKHESASACRRSLVKDGWLMDSGRTLAVPDTGNPAIVWVLDGQLF